MTGVWLAVGFVGGVVVGVMWREAYELLRGRDTPMALLHRLRDTRQHLLTLGLVVSMVFTGLVGIQLALSNGARGDLVDCISDYNRAAGDARDDRNAAAEALSAAETRYVDAELDYQRGLLGSIETDTDVARLAEVIRVRIVATQEYADALADQTRVREARPYPAPDFCGDR